MFEHAAHFAVLAFGQRHFDPAVLARTAFEIGLDPAVAHAVDLHAFDQLVQHGLRDVAEGPGAIGARNARRRQFHRPLQFAVIGKQQKPLGVEVEAADRHHAPGIAGQRIAQGGVNRRASLGVAFRRDQARRLVEGEEARFLCLFDRLAVDGHAAQRAELHGRRVEHLTIERHAPLGNHAFHLAAAGHTRTREQLGDAVAIFRKSVVGHSRAVRRSVGGAQGFLDGLVVATDTAFHRAEGQFGYHAGR